MERQTDKIADRVGTPLLVRVEEAARLCTISRSQMWELIGQGEILSVRIGRSRRVPTEALRRWIDELSQAGQPGRQESDR